MQRISSILSRAAAMHSGVARATVTTRTAMQCNFIQQCSISNSSYCMEANVGSSGSGKKTKHPTKLGPHDEVPSSFYDKATEDEKQLFDMVDSMAAGVRSAGPYDIQSIPGDQSVGLHNLTGRPGTLTFDKIDAAEKNATAGLERTKADEEADWRALPNLGTITHKGTNLDQLTGEQSNFAERTLNDPSFQETMHIDSLLEETFDQFADPRWEDDQPPVYIPQEMLNTTLPWRMVEEHENPEFAEQFIPRSSPELYRHDQQGLRSCEGKKQRQGVKGALNCHILDLKELSAFDIPTLRRFLTSDSEILNRKSSGLCAKCQRAVAKTVKRARQLGVLAHIDEYVIKDEGYRRPDMPFHAQAEEKEANFALPSIAKTIL